MSLNSVVNNLVRAAAGIPADITDSDLDKHVAELLAREAKERDAKWSEIGLGGLLGNDRSTPDPNAPKPNKRFLASIIRTVDTHNSSVIRQQLEAAETARSAAGLGESSRSAASRMFGGAMRDASQSAHSRRGRSDRDRAEREREQRWHDKRQGSRERRTRYDVGEEEEMFNAGVESLPESKGSRDWMKRKSEKDARRRREESSDDEESRRRRRDLYGDEEEDGRSTRRRRRSPDHETKGKDRERDRPREDRADRNERYGEKASSRRNERRNSDGEHDGENRRDRRRRLRAEREAAGEGGIDHEEKGGADATSRPHRTEALQDDVERDPSSRRETSPGQKRLEKEYVSTRKRDRDQDGLSRSEPHRREADDKAKRGRHARDSASPNRQVDQDRKARRHRDDEQEHRSRRHDNPSPRPTEARDTERKRTRDRSSEAVKEKEKNIKASSSSRPTRLPSTSPPPSRLRSSPSPAARRPAISPSPGPPPPDDLIPPPPDTPPPPPPPAPSKMDKYFQTDYDPRLDLGEVPRNSYVPEVGWDNMLAILKERGKKPRNRSPGLYDDPMEIPKIHLRRSPSPTLKEIEKAERRAKRAQRGFDDDFETEAERSKRKAERKKEKEERARVTQLGPGDGGGLLEVTYVKKGGVREWDMGK